MSFAENYLLYYLNKIKPFNESEVTLAYGYTFYFKKYNNTVRFANDQDTVSSYIIQVDIKNNIGVIIYSFKMNESDTLRVMDCMANFLYYMTDTGCSMYIGLPAANNSNNHFPSIYLLNTSRVYNDDICVNNHTPLADVNFNYGTGESRYMDFTIIDDGMAGISNTNQILKLPISGSELEDILYHICIAANMDFGEYLETNIPDSPLLMY